jgi:hypothetical protein
MTMMQPGFAAEPPCKLKRATLLQAVSLDRNRIHIPAILGETSTFLILDTGGFRSFAFEDFVNEAGFEIVTSTIPLARDGAGKGQRKGVWISPIQIGNLRRDEPYAFLLSPGGEKTSNGDSVGGIFGADFLKMYDLELNMARSEVGLFQTRDCKPTAAYWANEWVEIPFDNRADHVIVDVELDGKKLKAMVDTGAPMSILDLDTAKKVYGLNETLKSTGNVTWGMGKETNAYEGKFNALSFDGIVVQNPKLVITDMKGSEYEMIVGMQHLKKMRLFISYSQAKIFATPAQ